MTELTIPLPPGYTYGLLWLIGIALASTIIGYALPSKDDTHGLGWIKAQLALPKAPNGVFLIGAVIWLIIFFWLIVGILFAAHELITFSLAALAPEPSASLVHLDDKTPPVTDWRFALFKLTALTATTAAVIGLPVTLWRTSISNKQNDLTDAALFNTKFNAASGNLAARRTVTFTARNVTWSEGDETHSHLEREDTPFTPPDGATEVSRGAWSIHSIEEPDIVTRSTAIDQIEQLVHERPEEAPRVASLLSIYVREHTVDAPPEVPPRDATPQDFHTWANGLSPKRNDVQKAAQSLGRLKEIPEVKVDEIQIDLRKANLQGFDLSYLNFESALIAEAKMQGANLRGAWLKRADLRWTQVQSAIIFNTYLRCADLRGAQLQGASITRSQLQGANLSRAQLQRAIINQTQMQGANLFEAQLQGCYVFNSQMHGTDLRDAELRDSKLYDSELDGATLRMSEDDITELEPSWQDAASGDSVFLDASTQTPSWLTDKNKFKEKWHAWQETLPDFDPSWRGQ